MRASSESGGNDLLQCSQVGRSSNMMGLLRLGIVACTFYAFESEGSMVRWWGVTAAESVASTGESEARTAREAISKVTCPLIFSVRPQRSSGMKRWEALCLGAIQDVAGGVSGSLTWSYCRVYAAPRFLVRVINGNDITVMRPSI